MIGAKRPLADYHQPRRLNRPPKADAKRPRGRQNYHQPRCLNHTSGSTVLTTMEPRASG